MRNLVIHSYSNQNDLVDDMRDKKNNADGTMRVSSSSVFTVRPIIRRDILSQIEGPGSPQQILITKNFIHLGRSGDADIQFDSNLVSRKHISLSREGSDLICRDLNSHNGLYLNGIRVHSVALRDGDILQIGDVVLIFHQGVQWTSS